MNIVLTLLLMGCPPKQPAAEALSPPPSPLLGGIDASMLPLCQRVLAGDRSAEPEIAAHPLVGNMASGMRQQVVFTAAELAAAAFSEQADERFSWDMLRKNAAFVAPFSDYVVERSDGLVLDSLGRATRFVPIEIRPEEVRVNMVCGGRWDAYVLIFERPEIYFDVGYYGDAPLDEAIPAFLDILDHELWHLAFVKYQEQRWPCAYRTSDAVVSAFFYRVLNEGIAHYYSLRSHLEPTLTVDDLSAKEAHAFALLAERYPVYKSEADPKLREDFLWSSHAGVPFWEKWGALTGAFVTWHLLQDGGADEVSRLIAEEPFSFFLAYDERSRDHADWPRLPAEIVSDARNGLDQYQAWKEGRSPMSEGTSGPVDCAL